MGMINLAETKFASSSSYIINGKSKQKLYELLEKNSDGSNIPYDLFIRDLVRTNRLKAYCCFPFLTSLSTRAEISQIQSSADRSADPIWNTFRRMMWIDADPALYRASLDRIAHDFCDEDSKAMGTIAAAMLSGRFTPT